MEEPIDYEISKFRQLVTIDCETDERAKEFFASFKDWMKTNHPSFKVIREK